MTIGFNTLFSQRDVRITPISTATATAVGLTDGKYIVTDYHADMTDERKITEGGGIDFTDAGANSTFTIALKNKTSYWSASGNSFLQRNNDTIFTRQFPGDYKGGLNDESAFCPVHLPHGAVVTAAAVYGDTAAKVWKLYRAPLISTSGGAIMATANINTVDSSISNATIDNSTYGYYLFYEDLDNQEEIWGALITYTTDYI